MPFPYRRNRRFFLRIAAISLCLFAAGTGAAYAWYSAAVNSGNRITVGRVEIAFDGAGVSEKYFETELTPIDPGEFAPEDFAAATAQAQALGSERVAESTVTLRSRASTALAFRLTLDDSAYGNAPAVRSSLRFWCYDTAGTAKKRDVPFADFGEISGSLEAGASAEYRFFVTCLSNGFAEGQSLRFDLRAESTAGGEASYPAEIENGDFEDGGAGWTGIPESYQVDAYIKNSIPETAESLNQNGTYFLCSSYFSMGFRSSLFTLSGEGFLRFKLSGAGVSVKAFLSDGTQVGYFRYNEPTDDEVGGIYVMRTYVADLRAYLGSGMYLEVWFEESGEQALADDFRANDPKAADYLNQYDEYGYSILPWTLLENLL